MVSHSPFWVADATRGIPLSNLTPEMLQSWGLATHDAPISGVAAWRNLGIVYRAIDVRAKAISRAPLALYQGNGTTDVSRMPRYTPLLERLRALLYLNEAALCVYGAAYWVIETNAVGRNPTPRWLVPSSIRPTYAGGEVSGFVRTVQGVQTTLAPDQMVWWWEPNLLAETGPGPPVIARALAAAGALHHLNLYVSRYFEHGAIKAYVLQASGNPPQAERERIKSAWRRLLSGIRAAFAVDVFSTDMTFTPVGDSLKETVNPELTAQAREDILQTFGVPLSMVLSNAANFATAQQDALNLYTQTIQPQMEAVHLPPLNTWLATIGLRLDILWQKLEVFQAQQLAQAQAVNQLVGAPILTVDEGRDLIGYPPQTTPVVPQPVTPPAPAPAPAPIAVATASVVPDAAQQTALAKWERKARKRLKESGVAACDFTDAALPPARAAQITRALATATTDAAVRAAFVPTTGRIRTAADIERLFADAMRRADRIMAEAQDA